MPPRPNPITSSRSTVHPNLTRTNRRRLHSHHTNTNNSLRELWALFHYLLPDVFTAASAELFETGFDAQRSLMDITRMQQARALLSLLMLRRRKDQISMTLPPKTELAVVCGLSDAQRAWYKRVLTGVRAELLTGAAEMPDGEWRKLLNLLMQLRKVHGIGSKGWD